MGGEEWGGEGRCEFEYLEFILEQVFLVGHLAI